jgi:hypothetical protein
MKLSVASRGFSWLKVDPRALRNPHGSGGFEVAPPSAFLVASYYSMETSRLYVDPRCSTEFLVASTESAWLQELRAASRGASRNSKGLYVTPRSSSSLHVLTRILKAPKHRPCLAPSDSKRFTVPKVLQVVPGFRVTPGGSTFYKASRDSVWPVSICCNAN